jgi:tetratricopeptide (TPR) repeat protein
MKHKPKKKRNILAAYCFVVSMLLVGTPVQAASQSQTIMKKSAVWMKICQQASKLTKEQKYAEAELLYKQIICDRVNLDLDLNAQRSDLAQLYAKSGKPEEAETLFKINIRTREQQDGPNGYTLMYPLNEYAGFLATQGRATEASQLKDRVQAIELKAEGKTSRR